MPTRRRRPRPLSGRRSTRAPTARSASTASWPGHGFAIGRHAGSAGSRIERDRATYHRVMTDLRADPNAPLSDAPEPWTGSSTPSARSGPPWHMTEMIEAEPALARRILERHATSDGEAARLAATIRGVAAGGGPIGVVG